MRERNDGAEGDRRQVAVFLWIGRKRRRRCVYMPSTDIDRPPDSKRDSKENEEEEKETKEEYKRGIQSSAKGRRKVKEGEREGGRNTLYACVRAADSEIPQKCLHTTRIRRRRNPKKVSPGRYVSI